MKILTQNLLKKSFLTLFLLNTFTILASSQDVQILMQENIFSKVKKAPGFSKLLPSSVKHNSGQVQFELDANKLPALTKATHQTLEHCGGYRTFFTQAELDRYLKKVNEKATSVATIRKALANVQNFSFTQGDAIEDWFTQIDRPRMNAIIDHLSSYPTRYYTSPTGIEAMEWIYQKWRTITKGRRDVTVSKFKHAKFDQPSIILTFKASTDTTETLVLGGHGDSINTDDGPQGLAPGADDNAAGIALLSEVIQLMVNNNYQPKKNITFMAYAAEEVGILGSYEITDHYRANKENVIGVLQFDGTNFQGKSYDMALIADLTNKDQNDFLGELIDHYVKVSWTYQKCHYACSDHAAWNYEGYPASFPAETTAAEQNPYFHTTKDTFDKSNYDTIHAEHFVKLAVAYLLEKDAQ